MNPLVGVVVLFVSLINGGTPGGVDTQVQFNDRGAFGGDAGLVYDKTTRSMTAGGSVTSGNFVANTGSGSNGFFCSTNGCRFDFGAGASDYATSDGSVITFAAPVESTGSHTQAYLGEGMVFEGDQYNGLLIAADPGAGNGNSVIMRTKSPAPLQFVRMDLVPELSLARFAVYVQDQTGSAFASLGSESGSADLALRLVGPDMSAAGIGPGGFGVGKPDNSAAGVVPGWVWVYSPDGAYTYVQGGNLSFSATALGTCGSGDTEGTIRRLAGTGGSGTGARTRMCLCTSDGAVSPTYAWQNLVTGTVGNAATCSP